MGRHGHQDHGYRNGHVRRNDPDPRMTGGPVDLAARPRLPRRFPTLVVLVGLALWSLFAWIGYASVDPVLGWIASNAGLLVDGAKELATASDAGKEAGSVLDNLKVSGILGQAIALLQAVLKPAIVIVWAVGAAVLVAAPLVLSKIGALLARRRH